MSSKKSVNKLTKYCRIFQWVEVKSEALAEAIRDLCMEGSLSAGGRKSGTTFIYPSEKVRKSIIEKAYSDKAEEAIDLLNAHIISDPVRTTDDFQRGVGSRYGIKLEVKSTDLKNMSVTLVNGAKLKVASDFHPLRKDNIAVWVVESGEVPLEGPEYKPPKRGRGEPNYTGGSTDKRVDINSRSMLASSVESRYDVCMKKDRCKTEDPYLSNTVSLLNFIKQEHPETYNTILPIIDRDPAVSFYLLIEPYKTSNDDDYVLSDDVLFGSNGWNGTLIFEKAVTEFKSMFDSLSQQTEKSAKENSSGNMVIPHVFRDTAAIRKEVDDVRMQIIGDDGRKANKIKTPNAVCEAYKTLHSQNSIGGVQPVMPDSTISLLSNSKKLWQDELRFTLHAAFMTLRSYPMYNTQDFTDIINTVKFNRPGNDYSSEASITNNKALNNNVAPASDFHLLLKFINSTDFLYLPVSSEKIGGAWGNIPTTGQLSKKDDIMTVYNSEESKNRLHDSYISNGLDDTRAISKSELAMIKHHINRGNYNPADLGF